MTRRMSARQTDLFAARPPPVSSPSTKASVAAKAEGGRTLLDAEELWDLVELARNIAEDEEPRGWEALRGLEEFLVGRDSLLREIEVAVGLTDWVSAHRSAVALAARLLWCRMYPPEEAGDA
jgi:hypothetical protein